MSNLLKSKFLFGVMIVAIMFVGAFALTSVASAYTHTVTLKWGVTNAQVMSLQQALNSTSCKVAVSGAGSAGMETMYFGGLTKAAVMCYQSSHGLTADGIVGPITGASLGGVVAVGGTPGCPAGALFNSMTGAPCGVSYTPGCPAGAVYNSMTGALCSGGSSSPSGPLVGGAGSLDDVEFVSSLSDEEVAEGESNAKVAGWTLTADNGSDLAITAFKLSFDMNDTSGTPDSSDQLDDYADKVTVWQGSTKIGSADVADFSENSNVYSKTINLSGAVIKADKDSDFFVSVDAVNNIDSDDLAANTWTLSLEQVRFQDATGAIITDSSTGDIGGDVDFSFETVAAATGTELKVSKTTGSSGDAVNDGHVVDIDDTSDTNDVPLLAFDLKATGDIQNIQDIPVKLVSSGTGTVVDIASSFTLWMDGTQIDSVNDGEVQEASVATTNNPCDAASDTTCWVHFDDVDFDMNDGDSGHFVVKADIRDTSSTLVGGDTLTASIGSTEVDAIDAEDANGDSVDTGDLTGTAIADNIAFYDKGIMVKLVGTPTAVISHAADLTLSTDDDQATWTVTFDVTAFGDDMRVDDDVLEDTSPFTTVTQLSYSLDGTSTIAGSPAATLTSGTGATHDTESFLVEEGTTERFTASVTGTASNDGYSNMKLEGVGWTAGVADAIGANIYTFNLDDFKTAEIYLNSN